MKVPDLLAAALVALLAAASASAQDYPTKNITLIVPFAAGGPTDVVAQHAIIGVKPVTVPFNGTGPSMNALVGGQVDYMCDQIVNAVPQIKAGTIKAYAIATPERTPRSPMCRSRGKRAGRRAPR
jgi:tripartite-type tricarboxylate transporter receptor subunit TctC